LRASERAISEANRALASLEDEARRARSEARRHVERGASLERSLGAQREALGRLVAARAASGAPDVLRVALSGDDASDIARHLHYLGRISAAAARLIAEFRSGQSELDALKQAALERAARLAEIDAAQRRDRERIVAERGSRRRILDSVAAEIRRSRREIAVLRADEARLSRVIEEIGRVLAARPGAGYARPAVPDGAPTGNFSTARPSAHFPSSAGASPARSRVDRRALPRGSARSALAPGGRTRRCAGAGTWRGSGGSKRLHRRQGDLHPGGRRSAGACRGGWPGGVCGLDARLR